MMTTTEVWAQLPQWLELPEEVQTSFAQYDAQYTPQVDDALRSRLLCRNTWDDAVAELRQRLDPDPTGLRMLWELLHVACGTYARYEERGISQEIFVETMKFCTRFLHTYYQEHGCYHFVWDWWFPRQLAMLEYRVGCLEYELIDGEAPLISVHIPSDADLSAEAVDKSMAQFDAFLRRQYPQWVQRDWYCESWMMSPTLRELLPEGSRILAFQSRFTVLEEDKNSPAVMDWVFRGCGSDPAQLPEDTTLRRNLKRLLLQGGNVGWTKAVLRRSEA